MVPNILRYATKELAQDAAICWLVACARDTDSDLQTCGLSFVQALMHSGVAAWPICTDDLSMRLAPSWHDPEARSGAGLIASALFFRGRRATRELPAGPSVEVG